MAGETFVACEYIERHGRWMIAIDPRPMPAADRVATIAVSPRGDRVGFVLTVDGVVLRLRGPESRRANTVIAHLRSEGGIMVVETGPVGPVCAYRAVFVSV